MREIYLGGIASQSGGGTKIQNGAPLIELLFRNSKLGEMAKIWV